MELGHFIYPKSHILYPIITWNLATLTSHIPLSIEPSEKMSSWGVAEGSKIKILRSLRELRMTKRVNFSESSIGINPSVILSERSEQRSLYVILSRRRRIYKILRLRLRMTVEREDSSALPQNDYNVINNFRIGLGSIDIFNIKRYNCHISCNEKLIIEPSEKMSFWAKRRI